MKAIGYVPAKGFPRGPNPQAILTEREIPVKIVQLSRSKVSSELLMKGIQGMKTGGRKLMLEDIQKKRFRIVGEDVDLDIKREDGDEDDVATDVEEVGGQGGEDIQEGDDEDEGGDDEEYVDE